MKVLLKALAAGAARLTIGLLIGVPPMHAGVKTAPAAARFAVPILCTDNRFAPYTRARGTGVIVDSTGLILTAAHVILEAGIYCTFTVLVPNDEWNRAGKFFLFALERCLSDRLMDVAVCHLAPQEHAQGRSFLTAGVAGSHRVLPGDLATITGFTGWGWFPTVASGAILPPQLYETHEGCHCDLAVKTTTHEGMSGSPIVDEEGMVIGIVTRAGTGQFRGITFGTTIGSARGLLRKQGWAGALAR
jgi:hypothetical protein